MKTLLRYSLTLALLAVALHLNANTPPTVAALPEEAYIDDIPFNTGQIFDSLYDVSLTDTYQLTDENYISDIPFNTAEVAADSVEFDTNTFTLESETYIDDIPFSTKDIAKL
ncbi:MAG: hypothetical protein CVT99_03480 [Bacteroidetes bacterium HGW-Bacteroidetes-16]|jgi:hypothetical protein|nr:MAG: hypothetical protein CVT99_03480 [Bacteroidetes bacterium HGW-Bacteroidetes-16]